MAAAKVLSMSPARPTAASPNADPTQMNDLLRRVAISGDREAFGRIYAYFAPRVKGYLMRVGTSGDLAEDLAQETLLKVWRKAKLYDPEKASAATWIFTIARNARIDAARRAAKPDLDADEPGLAPEAEPQADELVARAERDERIRAAFQALPENQLQVVTLHFIEDAPHSEIAARLGLPLGTVKSRLRLAFEKIRKDLGDLHA